jgi:hypothetical protein
MLREKILTGALICAIAPLMLVLDPECPLTPTAPPSATALSSNPRLTGCDQ